ncbi:MAG: DNA repair protein RadC [Vicinamibacterales bacterium]
MKDLALDDRPREKLLRHGAAALGDNELIAIVVGSGTRGADALVIANELLKRRGGLQGLIRSSADDLALIGGIGRARAAQVIAALELGRRTLRRGPARVQLRTPQDAAAYLLPVYGGRPVEQFGLVLLDSRHRVLRTTIVASGTLNSTIVQPRDVFREAVVGLAAAVVVFHNHPSGDPSPSQEDVELTRRLRAAGVLMGVDVVDHIVLGDVRYLQSEGDGAPLVSRVLYLDGFSGSRATWCSARSSMPACRSTS